MSHDHQLSHVDDSRFYNMIFANANIKQEPDFTYDGELLTENIKVEEEVSLHSARDFTKESCDSDETVDLEGWVQRDPDAKAHNSDVEDDKHELADHLAQVNDKCENKVIRKSTNRSKLGASKYHTITLRSLHKKGVKSIKSEPNEVRDEKKTSVSISLKRKSRKKAVKGIDKCLLEQQEQSSSVMQFSVDKPSQGSQSAKMKKKKEPLECCVCRQQIKSQRCLRDHLNSHVEKMSVMCALCNLLFTTNKKLKDHSILKHRGIKRVYQCNKCVSKFAGRRELVQHEKKHINDGNVVLSVGFKNEIIDEDSGNKNKVEYSRWNCARCNVNFSRRSDYFAHNKQHHERKSGKTRIKHEFKCEGCDRIFKSNIKLKRHCLMHDAECVATNNVDMESTTVYICKECGKTYKRLDSLARHKKSHSNEVFICEKCGTAFKLALYLRKHVKRCKGTPFRRRGNQSSKVCHVCGYSTIHPSSMRVHLRTHSGEKPYSCDLCPYRSSTSCIMKIHYRTHTGEKPFPCSECDMAFAQKAGLLAHFAIKHVAERPFKCNACSYSAANKWVLRMHRMTHTGETPYECSDCGRRFNKPSNLTMHKRIHTGEKPYVCKECGHAFNGSGNLTKHLASVHNIMKSHQSAYRMRVK